MKFGRVIALVIGSLLIFPALGMILGGGALGVAHAFQRDDGYLNGTLDRLESSTVAITAEDIDLMTDPGTPGWIVDALDADVRLLVTAADSGQEVFVGIGPDSAVDQYLQGVAHSEIDDVDGDRAVYRQRTGGSDIVAPGDQDFWSASTSGVGTQELLWESSSGRWSAVLMNADGSPGVAADVNVGVKAGFLLPLALILGGIGTLLTVLAIGLILIGAAGFSRSTDELVAPAPLVGSATSAVSPTSYPLQLNGHLDPELSRWQWLVKWILAIPHFVILFFLWAAFAVLTLVAGFAILFTGRYPRGIFDFNVGVMRWSWRVSFYATSGGIGTDRYPPFTLQPDPSYPASLHVDYPSQLSRGLVLVKWWLLAIPHYLIVALLVGGGFSWATTNNDRVRFDPTGGGGLLGLLVLVAGLVLLFTSRYPRALFDLIVGLNRWVYRVLAYAALMTDQYPPFRLDQGGEEPHVGQPGPPPTAPTEASQLDLRPSPGVPERTG